MSAIDSDLFLYELTLERISAAESDANAASVKAMRTREHGPASTAMWILPNFNNMLDGGARTAFMTAEHMSRTWGTRNLFVLFKTNAKENLQDAQKIQGLIPGLKFSLRLLSPDEYPADLPKSDIALCLSWPTAYALARYDRCGVKFYFMQDYYEAFLRRADSHSALIHESCAFGFYCLISAVKSTSNYHQLSTAAAHFTSGIEHTIFHPDPSKRRDRPFIVTFYGRQGNQHNGFMLELEALKQVKRHIGERVRIVSTVAFWQPAAYSIEGLVGNLGVLSSLHEVAALYQSSHVGIVSMLTPIPAYQPIEVIVCGCIIVTNINTSTKWLFEDGVNAVMTAPIPNETAAGVIRVLENASLRERILPAGLRTASSMGWQTAFGQIATYLGDPDGASSAAV